MYSLKICELYFHRAIQNYKKQSPVNIKDGELCHNIFWLKAVNYTAQKKPADLVTFLKKSLMETSFFVQCYCYKPHNLRYLRVS